MNKQPKKPETLTVFYLFEGGVREFEIPIKPYNLDNELNPQSNTSGLETITE